MFAELNGKDYYERLRQLNLCLGSDVNDGLK